MVLLCCLSGRALTLGRRVARVWIGGILNDHLRESEKCFGGRNLQENLFNSAERAFFFPNFRLRNLIFQSPQKCNSIPPAILPPFSHTYSKDAQTIRFSQVKNTHLASGKVKEQTEGMNISQPPCRPGLAPSHSHHQQHR